MLLNVETRHGDYEEDVPVAFMLGARRIGVTTIADRWLAESHSYYKVRADDGALYILRRDNPAGIWELTLFRATP